MRRSATSSWTSPRWAPCQTTATEISTKNATSWHPLCQLISNLCAARLRTSACANVASRLAGAVLDGQCRCRHLTEGGLHCVSGRCATFPANPPSASDRLSLPPQPSARVVELSKEDGHHYLKDLRTSCGVWLNNRKVLHSVAAEEAR